MNLFEMALGLIAAIVYGAFALVKWVLTGVARLLLRAVDPAPVVAPTPASTPQTSSASPALLVPAAAVMPAAPVAAAATPRTIADFHVLVQFSDSFTASVSVHKAEQIVRRKMRAISEPAAQLMRSLYLKESFDLPDVKLGDGVTYEDAILNTESVGMRFIQELLSTKGPQEFVLPAQPVATGVGTPDPFKAPVVDPEQAARSLAMLRGEAAAVANVAETAPSATPQSAPATVRVSGQGIKRTAKAFAVGRVLEFGYRVMQFQSGKDGSTGREGKTFEAVIECDNGDCVSHRGVRLEELFKENGVKVGDRVEVVSLGRTRVTLADGEPKFRNEFNVRVLELAAKG